MCAGGGGRAGGRNFNATLTPCGSQRRRPRLPPRAPPPPEPPPPAPARAPIQALRQQPRCSHGGPFSSGHLRSRDHGANRTISQGTPPRSDRGQREGACWDVALDFSVGSQLRSKASFLLRTLPQGLVAPGLAWLARLPRIQCWPASPASSPGLSEVRSIEACLHPTVSLPKPWSRLPLLPASPACPDLTQTWERSRSASSSPGFPDHASSCRKRRPETWVCAWSCSSPPGASGFSAVLCLAAQSCPPLCDLPGSSVQGILQARILE